MEATKLHLLVAIVATQAVALYNGKLPYFPIEISRTAASSLLATRVLSGGFISAIITMYLSKALTWHTFIMWMGLCITAMVPDTRSIVGHMFGPVLVFVGALTHALNNPHPLETVSAVGMAMIIFVLRICLKVGVLLLFDTSSRSTVTSLWSIVGHAHVRNTVKNRALDIMFRGDEAFIAATNTINPAAKQAIVAVFKVCGVLQCVAFYALSFVL